MTDKFITVVNKQEVKEGYVLSGVWQVLSKNDLIWYSLSDTSQVKRIEVESQGHKTRDLYIKA